MTVAATLLISVFTSSYSSLTQQDNVSAMTNGPDIAVSVDDGLTTVGGSTISYDETGPYDAGSLSASGAIDITSSNNGTSGNYTVYENLAVTAPGQDCIDITGAQYILIRNMTIDNCHNGIDVTNSNNIIIEHVEFTATGNTGITGGFNAAVYGSNSNNVTIRRVHMEDLNGIGNSGPNFYRINGVFFENNSDSISVEYSTYLNEVGAHFAQFSNNAVMSNSRISGNAGQLTSGGSSAHDVINIIQSGGSNGDPVEINSNVIVDNGDSIFSTGVIVGDAPQSGTAYDYAVVSDNILINPGLVGINVYDGSHHVIDNNVIRSAAFAWSDRALGARQYTDSGTCDNITFSNNRMNYLSGGLYGTSGQHYGFWNSPSDPCTNVTLTGNTGQSDGSPDTSIADDLYIANHDFDVTFTNNGNVAIGAFDFTLTPAVSETYRHNYTYLNQGDNSSYASSYLTGAEENLSNTWTGGCLQPGESIVLTAVGHVFEDSGATLRTDASVGSISNCSSSVVSDADSSNDTCFDTTLVGGSDVSGAPGEDCSIPLSGNNAPTDITFTSAPLSLEENNTTDTHLTAITSTDADGGDSHTYTLTCSTPGADDGLFQIITASGPHLGHLHTNNAFDFENPTDNGGTPGDNVYEVCVRSTDDGTPNLSYDETVNVTITNDTGDDVVVDTTDPVITLLGTTPIDHVQGNAYTDAGATATDDTDGSITGSIVVGGDSIDNSTPIGNYTITYDVQDAAGNDANQVTRAVNVIASGGGNNDPTDILLSSNTLVEEQSENTTIGLLTTTDADGSDSHTYSIVSGAGDEDNGLFTLLNLSQDSLGLTISPDFELPSDENTDNVYNVRIQTDDGNGGTYQEALQITVTNDVADDPDTDGISDAVEDDAPNGGDFNNDSTPDSTQNNVATTPNTKTNSDAPGATAENPNRYVGLESPAGTSISNFVINSESELSSVDETRDYPLGIFGFDLTVPSGSTQSVVIYLDQEYSSSVTDTWSWVKYNSTTDEYTEVPDSANLSYSTATVGTDTVTTVTYSVTDGGLLDEDGVANGTIVDPIGPSVLAATDGDTADTTDTGTDDELADTGLAAGLMTLSGAGILALAVIAWSAAQQKLYRLRAYKS